MPRKTYVRRLCNPPQSTKLQGPTKSSQRHTAPPINNQETSFDWDMVRDLAAQSSTVLRPLWQYVIKPGAKILYLAATSVLNFSPWSNRLIAASYANHTESIREIIQEMDSRNLSHQEIADALGNQDLLGGSPLGYAIIHNNVEMIQALFDLINKSNLTEEQRLKLLPSRLNHCAFALPDTPLEVTQAVLEGIQNWNLTGENKQKLIATHIRYALSNIPIEEMPKWLSLYGWNKPDLAQPIAEHLINQLITSTKLSRFQKDFKNNLQKLIQDPKITPDIKVYFLENLIMPHPEYNLFWNRFCTGNPNAWQTVLGAVLKVMKSEIFENTHREEILQHLYLHHRKQERIETFLLLQLLSLNFQNLQVTVRIVKDLVLKQLNEVENQQRNTVDLPKNLHLILGPAVEDILLGGLNGSYLYRLSMDLNATNLRSLFNHLGAIQCKKSEEVAKALLEDNQERYNPLVQIPLIVRLIMDQRNDTLQVLLDFFGECMKNELASNNQLAPSLVAKVANNPSFEQDIKAQIIQELNNYLEQIRDVRSTQNKSAKK